MPFCWPPNGDCVPGAVGWRIDAGSVMADKGVGFLVSKESYGDFEIRAEFWADDNANSGIFIRCKDRVTLTAATCYEVNIYDKRPDPLYGTGAIVDVISKSGTNRFGGSFKYLAANDNWNKQNSTKNQVTDASNERLKFDKMKVVFFKIEDDAAYGEVVKLMDTVRGAGAKTLGIVTKDLAAPAEAPKAP